MNAPVIILVQTFSPIPLLSSPALTTANKTSLTQCDTVRLVADCKDNLYKSSRLSYCKYPPMKAYIVFFQDGLAYWQAKLHVLCSALYLLYASPVDSPLPGGRRTRRRDKEAVRTPVPVGVRQARLPGLRGAFAL